MLRNLPSTRRDVKVAHVKAANSRHAKSCVDPFCSGCYGSMKRKLTCHVPDKDKPMAYKHTPYCCTRCEEYANGADLRPDVVTKLKARHIRGTFK